MTGDVVEGAPDPVAVEPEFVVLLPTVGNIVDGPAGEDAPVGSEDAPESPLADDDDKGDEPDADAVSESAQWDVDDKVDDPVAEDCFML